MDGMNNLFKFKTIILILLLAFILRIYDIGNNPKSMYGDELTLVYDAYSLLKTGMDQKGESWPLFFSMGGGRPAGYIYATIPFTAIFGPTALAARATSVLSGVGIVLLIFLISKILLSEKIGLAASFTGAIIPWELNLSRGAFESHFALFLALLGLYFFLLAQKKPIFYLISAVSFALSMQTYSTYVLSIPLFLGIMIYFFREKNFKVSPIFLLSVLVLILSLSFSIHTSINRGSSDRFGNLLLINQLEFQNQTQAKVGRERLYTPLTSVLALGLHNKYLEFINIASQNYLKSFGPDFLLLNGDKNPRHNPTSMGQIYLAGLPLIILGIVFLFKKNPKLLGFLSLWLLIGPLPGSLVGPPHSIRGSFMLPPLLILMGTGLYFLASLKYKKTKLLKISLVVLFLIQLPIFIYKFYLLSPNLNTSFWSYGAKRAYETAQEFKNQYDYIILSASIDDMEFAYPVYGKIAPSDVHFQNTHKTLIGEFKFLKYDNVYIGSIPTSRVREVMNSLSGSVMYLGMIEDRGVGDNELVIRNKDETPLFVISRKK